jgi:hypothetical protein
MIALCLLALPALLVGCVLLPGAVLARPLRFEPLEQLCVAIGMSLIVLYVAAFGLFATGASTIHYALVTAALLALSVAGRRSLRALLSYGEVRSALLLFGILFLWSLAATALIRHFGGGGWALDWLEHYERSLFFLGHFPEEHLFLDRYWLPARPPLMNLVTSFFLAQVGENFALFQVAFLFLNLLVVVPCWWLAREILPGGRPRLAVLLALLAMSPSLLENLTFCWTKLLTAYFVLTGVGLYVTGERRNRPAYRVAAFAALSAASLVHYSGAPYLVVIGGHWIFRSARRGIGGSEVAGVLGSSAALLATWVVWSVAVFGAERTFASPSTASGFHDIPRGEAAIVVTRNIFHSLVPYFLRGVTVPAEAGMNALASWRERAFLAYQTNLIAMMGSVGGIAVLGLLVRGVGRHLPAPQRSERLFWAFFVGASFLLGIGTHPPPTDPYGLAHISCQPLALLGLALLASAFDGLPRGVRCLVVAGCTLDFVLGVLLQLHLENEVFGWHVLTQGVEAGRVEGLGRNAVGNWIAKSRYGVLYLGDRLAGASSLLRAVLVAGAAVMLVRMSRTPQPSRASLGDVL